jgi:hypothetical protein
MYGSHDHTLLHASREIERILESDLNANNFINLRLQHRESHDTVLAYSSTSAHGLVVLLRSHVTHGWCMLEKGELGLCACHKIVKKGSDE